MEVLEIEGAVLVRPGQNFCPEVGFILCAALCSSAFPFTQLKHLVKAVKVRYLNGFPVWPQQNKSLIHQNVHFWCLFLEFHKANVYYLRGILLIILL